MNLLPKNHEDFRQNEYWENFFKKRGKRAFEWYGEYGELCGVLHKYIKPQEKVLVVGCGNSTLSEDLFDVGYHNIINVDLSETVIKQMKQRNEKKRPDMLYEVMDATKLTYEDSTFSVVLDKGTLDAMLPMGDSSAFGLVEKMFSEIDRVLKLGGRYICFSLLQPHILEHMVQWFSNLGWPIRILRCREVEDSKEGSEKWKFPVFAIIATKFKKMNNMATVLEMGLSNGGHMTRLKTTGDLINSVRGLQQFAAARAGSSDAFQGSGDARQEEASLDLLVPNSTQVRYSLYLVDRPIVGGLKFGVFIVPQGREVEWLFNTKDGRLEIAESTNSQRLVVVHLHRDQVYTSMDQIKEELSGYVMELAPADLPANTQVPFLSLGSDGGEVGFRQERCRGRSQLSGEFVVEDVSVNAEVYRRLVFFNNPKLIQSEAKLKPGKGSKKTIDESYLACSHHSIMIGSLGFFEGPIKCLIIGLGGGSLPLYIQNHLASVSLDVVEIDEAIIRVAKEQFGFQASNSTNVICQDGLQYIEQAAKSGSKYDVIMLDVDSKDPSVGMSSPPRMFVQPDFIQKILECFSEQGIFVLNLSCRDTTLRTEVIGNIRSKFPAIVTYDIPEEVNEVLICVAGETNKHKLMTSSVAAEDSKKKSTSKFEPTLKAFRKINATVSAKTKSEPIDLHQSMKQLQIL